MKKAVLSTRQEPGKIKNVEIKAVCYGNESDKGLPMVIISLLTNPDGKKYYLREDYVLRLEKPDFGKPEWKGYLPYAKVPPILESELNLNEALNNPTPVLQCPGGKWKKL